MAQHPVADIFDSIGKLCDGLVFKCSCATFVFEGIMFALCVPYYCRGLAIKGAIGDWVNLIILAGFCTSVIFVHPDFIDWRLFEF